MQGAPTSLHWKRTRDSQGANRREGYTPSPPGRRQSQNAVEPGPSPFPQGLGCYEIALKVGNRRMTHKILIIDNLQICCILGMDFMSQHNVIIDAAKLWFGSRPNDISSTKTLTYPKPVHLPANSEICLKFPVPNSFKSGLTRSGHGDGRNHCL